MLFHALLTLLIAPAAAFRAAQLSPRHAAARRSGSVTMMPIGVPKVRADTLKAPRPMPPP